MQDTKIVFYAKKSYANAIEKIKFEHMFEIDKAWLYYRKSIWKKKGE